MPHRRGGRHAGGGGLRGSARVGDLTFGLLNGRDLLAHVLGDEPFGVEVLDLEIGILGAEFLAQLRLGVVRDPPERHEHPGRLPRERGKLLGTEHDDAEYQKKNQLGGVDVEHTLRLPAAGRSTNPNQPSQATSHAFQQAVLVLLRLRQGLARLRHQ